jgi:hypothetical protein
LACMILWFGFYMLEAQRDVVVHVLLRLKQITLKWFSHLQTKPSESGPPATIEPEEKLITAPSHVEDGASRLCG